MSGWLFGLCINDAHRGVCVCVCVCVCVVKRGLVNCEVGGV